MNDFAELVINVTGDNVVTYSESQLIKRLEGKRPSGGMREQLMERVRMDSPCRVRFVPSLPAPLDGNVFDLLKLYRGELYLDVMGLDAVRVYFNRADFWGKGGVLVPPEPLSRDDVRLEPSNAFLQDVRQLNEAKTNQ